MNNPLNTLHRISLYQSKIQLDDYDQLMSLNLQKDNLKMYFVLFDEETKLRNELSMFLKQATQVLMYCQNDFRRFVGELLVVKHGKVTFRDINQVVEKLAIENIRKAQSQMKIAEEQNKVIAEESNNIAVRVEGKEDEDDDTSESNHPPKELQRITEAE